MGAAAGSMYRPMVRSDVGWVPIMHQGTRDEVLARIADLGSSALLAFDGDQHVGQLQFRRYYAGVRSPNGIWDPLYLMDFGAHAPVLPPDTLGVGCYHVGQLDDTADRDPRYQGQGIAAGLLDSFLVWARGRGFAAVVAKAIPPYGPVMEFLGGLPVSVYEARGFEMVARWGDPALARVVGERGLVGKDDVEAASSVACCVLRLLD